MSTIGLYDIDLWHRGKSPPNLELMKVYNYYQQQNQVIRMMRPNEDEGRYNKIIYFKDNPRIQIPRSLIVNGDKKIVYGYGFYNTFSPLRPEFSDVPPSYEPYDALSYKLRIPKADYDALKAASLVRLENKDYSDYKKSSRRLFFADHHALYQPEAYEQLLEYKNHDFYFLHTLRVKDEETYYKFERFFPLISNYIIIDFRYSADFFFDVYTQPKVIFAIGKREDETILNYQLRSVKMALYYKSRGIRQKFPFLPTPLDKTDEVLIKWITSPSTEAFDKSYSIPSGISSELRLLLKQDPKKVKTSSLDFYKNL